MGRKRKQHSDASGESVLDRPSKRAQNGTRNGRSVPPGVGREWCDQPEGAAMAVHRHPHLRRKPMKRCNRSRGNLPIFAARKVCLRLGLAWVACLLTVRAGAGDWPQFRYDAGRTAAATHELAAEVELRWTRTFGPPRPAFPSAARARRRVWRLAGSMELATGWETGAGTW